MAASLRVVPATVGKWRARFITDRLEGLSDEPRPGAARTITDERVERAVVKTLEEAPAGGDTHWSTRSMARTLHARAPWVDCPEHGVHQARLPWAEPMSRFTTLFERLAIDVLQACDVKSAAGLLRISWDEAWHLGRRRRPGLPGRGQQPGHRHGRTHRRRAA